MKITLRLPLLVALSTFAFASHAKGGWRKLSRETCAELLGHMRPQQLTITNIIDEINADALGTIKSCGQGCWEYEDWSTLRNSVQQIENERKVAAAYAESLSLKNEGLFLFSRYNGFDAPAWDGLSYNLSTGVITSKVSLKRGVTSRQLMELAFHKIALYSLEGGVWPKLALNWATNNPPRDWGFDRAFAHASIQIDKLARWLLVDDERIKSRIVFMQPDHRPMDSTLLGHVRKLAQNQTGNEVESVTLFDDEHAEIYEVAGGTGHVSLRRARRVEQ